MMYLKFNWRALTQVNTRLQKIRVAGEEAGKKALHETAKGMMRQSISMTPMDTGTARSSKLIGDIQHTRDSIKIEFGYAFPENDPINPETGKRASMYVYDIHEDFQTQFKVGFPKFLEVAVITQKDLFLERLEETIGSILGGV